MTQKQAVKAMLKATMKTQAELGAMMNPAQSQRAIATMLSRGNMTVNRLWEICEALGYEIALRPKKKGAANRDNTFVLECETKAERAEKLADKLHMPYETVGEQ